MSLADHQSIPGVALGPPHWSKVAGTVMCRVIVPAWVFAGASFKLFERDPQLLPPPVLDVVRQIGSAIGADLPTFLMFSMRAMIAVEFAAVAVMVLFPRLSRLVAASILGLFLIVLSAVLFQGFQKGGWSGMMSDCGCFGSSGPPAPFMLLIDAVLFVGVLAFRVPMSAHWPRIERKMIGITAAVAVAGAVVAFAVPNRTFVLAEGEDGGTEASTAGGTVSDGGGTSSTTPWSAPRPAPEPYYFTNFADWVGKPLFSQPLAQQISRPVPDGFDSGRWHLVLYRADCEHCHALLEEHFSGVLETPVLAVEVPDTDPSADLGMPCGECDLAQFTKGPQYVLTTPVLLTVVDGQVVCACDNVDDLAMVAECLDAQ
ncbi:MAG: MauE/DoxX family redox-associated membrane protein [Planctomycetota bacterium]